MSRAKDKLTRVRSLADIAKLGVFTEDTAASAPATGDIVSAGPLPGTTRQRGSVDVTRGNRAGRAPYNFVPLDDRPWPRFKDDSLPRHDHFAETLLTGRIEFELHALTRFFIRGMWPLADFARGNELNKQQQPFAVDGTLRLPGSSLRGMIRTLVETLGKAPLGPVDDQQLFFRAVAADDNPGSRSFEPQARDYKGRMVSGHGLHAQPAARAGYLHGGVSTWEIRPATTGKGGRQWYRIDTAERWKREKITFQVSGDWATRSARGSQGYLICSGPMPGKRAQWVVEAEDASAQKLSIPEDDVEAYLAAGRTQDIEKNNFDFSKGSPGVPCFYVEWQDRRGKKHVSFGHTPYFRLPYETTTAEAIPPENSTKDRTSELDLAQVIFGYVGESKKDRGARKGRLRFEDAQPDDDATARAVACTTEWAVLNGPKPTTYQHYLVQTSESVQDSTHWDAPGATVRGHKLYWHRPNAPLRTVTPRQRQKVASAFRPAPSGLTFRSSLAFNNLSPLELGVLLVALDLPDDCAHKLGMAKPLGFGSFRLNLKRVAIVSARERYSRFLSGDQPCLETGESDATAGQIAEWKDEFAAWYLGGSGPAKGSASRLWDDARLRELRALLTYKNLPKNWADITRYLEFGSIPNYPRRRPRPYNEYQEVGYPDEPSLEKRRPLPPASQVLRAGPSIPKDARPPFVDRDT